MQLLRNMEDRMPLDPQIKNSPFLRSEIAAGAIPLAVGLCKVGFKV